MTDKTQRAIQAAIAADEDRRREVMAMPEAQGREQLAETLFGTQLSVGEIRKCLASAQARSEAITKRVVAGVRERGFGRSGNADAPQPNAKAKSDKSPAAAPKPSVQSEATLKRVVAGIRARGYGRSNNDD